MCWQYFGMTWILREFPLNTMISWFAKVIGFLVPGGMSFDMQMGYHAFGNGGKG
tara:strand:- start:431 stop:592 length:162 start_codon:yes stop_codon:yes gene_type:complete